MFVCSWKNIFTKSSISTVVITIGDAIAVVEGVDGASSDSGLFKFGDIAATGVGANVGNSIESSDDILLSRFVRSFFTSIEDIASTLTKDDVEPPSSSGVMGLKNVIHFLE